MDSDHGENRRTSIPDLTVRCCSTVAECRGGAAASREIAACAIGGVDPACNKHVRAGYGGRWSVGGVRRICRWFMACCWSTARRRGRPEGSCLIMPLSVPQEMTISLNWGKCEGNVWCSFLSLNLAHPNFHGLEGVYIIWHGGPNPWTVYVGQGNVKDRLTAHRGDQQILQYSPHGLFATWAAVDRNSRSGIERYLADTLNPRVGHSHPHVVPVPVTLPW